MTDAPARKSGLYVVSEPACLYPNSGAGKHIQVGIQELSKYFNIKLELFCKNIDLAEEGQVTKSPFNKRSQNTLLKSVKSIVKWWWILVRNHISFFKYLHSVKKVRPDFIYERSAFLNFNGIVISKLLDIPHFYEINGLHYKDHSSVFDKFHTWLGKKLERLAYKRASGFFVGGINYEFGLPENERRYIIQNAIEDDFVSHFESIRRNARISTDRLNIVFVGHAMNHHRLRFLIEAIKLMVFKDLVSLHFVGSNYDRFLDVSDKHEIDIHDHGVKSHEQLKELLEVMHVGVIPYALEYYSNMKVFLYGAAKLAIVLPAARNFKHIFSEEEVFFFDNDDLSGLSQTLDSIASGKSDAESRAEKAFRRVRDEYTWAKVFKRIAAIINSYDPHSYSRIH